MINLLKYIAFRCNGNKAEFARLMNVKPQTITKWINGERFISEDGYLCIRHQKIPDFEKQSLEDCILLLQSVTTPSGQSYQLGHKPSEAIEDYSKIKTQLNSELIITAVTSEEELSIVATVIENLGGVFADQKKLIEARLHGLLWRISEA